MRILCVHQGYELYGSDRCFIDSVRSLRGAFPDARLTVLIPNDGPLFHVLKRIADDVRIADLWVIRKHTLRRLIAHGVVSLPLAVARAMSHFRKSDLVYINTVVVLDYLLAAKFFSKRALLHVHEAPEGTVGTLLSLLVRYIGVPTIFNSQSTRDVYRPRRSYDSYVLYNGVPNPQVTPCSYDGRRPLRLLMLGRLSRSKGQDILIAACARLPRAIVRRVEIRIVGSSFGKQTALEQGLTAAARLLAGPEVIRFEPFVCNPEPLYEWCDLAVVPSRVREGFGRVAVEAAAHARGAIVAGHGGLPEIVCDQETGWCFPPNQPAALAEIIRTAVEDARAVRECGAAARVRYERLFASHLVDAQMRDIVRRRFEPRTHELTHP